MYREFVRVIVGALIGAILIPIESVEATDWPQHLGPQRNGTYPGDDIAKAWPGSRPPQRWEVKTGTGYSGPAVAAGKLILFHRQGSDDIIQCLDAGSGKALWTFSYATDYRDRFDFDDGPRATPTIDGLAVYTLGAAGTLHAVDLNTGKKLWRYDTQKKYGIRESFFGAACSPLVEENLVLVNVGDSSGAAILALDKKTGKVLWSLDDQEASYSSPAAATIGDRRHVFFFTRTGLVDVDPRRGKVRTKFRWRARMHNSVNAATPLVVGDKVFLSECYGPGAILLGVRDKGVEKIWSAKKVLSNHYVTSVHKDGYLYGLDGRQEARPYLTCVELASGKPQWTQRRFGTGSVIVAGSDLLILTEDGELVRVAASPTAYEPKQRAFILSSAVRALPALANGRLYARDENKLVCVDLRGDGD